MKPTRILEAVGVPLALACVGWYATPLAGKLIALLGREYATTSLMDAIRPMMLAAACGFAAGVAAVVVQRKRAGSQRWGFYTLIASTVLMSAALILLIEAIRPRHEELLNGFGLRMQFNISSVPFWILGAGFWLPFLLFFRRGKPAEPPELTVQGDRS